MTNLDKSLKDKELVESASQTSENGVHTDAIQPTREIAPELVKKLVESRQRLHATLAQVVLAMIAAPRYKHCSIAELEHLVIQPLLRDRIAVAMATPKNDTGPGVNDGQLVGAAIWAKVSPEVDAKIREQIKAGVFPIRLKPDDWASGDIVWLLDVVAATKKQATAVLANIRQVVKEGNLFVHPIVRSLVDPELLKNATGATNKAEPAVRPTEH